MTPSVPACDQQKPASELTLLIVDDVPGNLAVLGELLQNAGYRVKAATSGEVALQYAAAAPKPELILLDVMMPEMDGYDVLARLRANPATQDIPVIFLTALGDSSDEEHGLSLGAADYMTKPIKPALILARVRTHLQAKLAHDLLSQQNARLEIEVARRMAENIRIQNVSIRALAHLAETRDPETGYHILRTQAYVHLLGTLLLTHPRFADILHAKEVDMIARSAPLHDIGKVGIPDHVLLKPGPLTPEEWVVMRTHAELGASAIEQAELDVDETVGFLTLAKDIARSHHERWDGKGYPQQLAGEQIPLAARLMALADVFDALISVRPYKRALSPTAARDIIAAEHGKHFDPAITDIFLNDFARFVKIAQRYNDDGGGFSA